MQTSGKASYQLSGKLRNYRKNTILGLTASRKKNAKFVNTTVINCIIGHIVIFVPKLQLSEIPSKPIIFLYFNIIMIFSDFLSFGHLLAESVCLGILVFSQGRCLIGVERRQFQRIPLAIPLFLRGKDKGGQKFLDFTLAVDISAGGALVATKRTLGRASWLYLEVPSAPIPILSVSLKSKRAITGRVVRSTDKGTYYLCAVRFVRPLI